MIYMIPLKRIIKINMFKKISQTIVAVLLMIFTVVGCIGCVAPNGKNYRSKESNLDAEETAAIMRSAEAQHDALNNILYTYDFHVDYKSDGKKYRFGTQNEIAFTELGTENASGHRINKLTSVKNETQQTTKEESFFYENGKIFAKRYGKYYWSEMKQENFLPYTEYSSMSANTDFFSEVFYEKATVYNLFNGDTCICFTKQSEYLDEGIISFIGLDQTDYEYSIDDVKLIIMIGKDGLLTEKSLTFSVEYYDKSDSDNVIEFDGEFSYNLLQTEDITVQKKDKANSYSEISNIELLSSLTNAGYFKLSDLPFDITYSKEVNITNIAKETEKLSYKASLNVKSLKTENNFKFSRINTEKLTIDTENRDEIEHITAGVFINGDNYKYLSYDYTKSKEEAKTEKDSTDTEFSDFITGSIEEVASERLISDDEIIHVTVTNEDTETVTFKVDVTADVKRSFAAYFYAYFQSDSTINFEEVAFQSERFDFLITVRKSDGCVMKQEFKYTAKITLADGSGSFKIDAECITKVNSTDENITFLTPDDFETEIKANTEQ